MTFQSIWADTVTITRPQQAPPPPLEVPPCPFLAYLIMYTQMYTQS